MKDKSEILDPALLEMVTTLKGIHIFDYGCGHGRIAEELAKRGLKVTAFDIAETIIEKKRERNRMSNLSYLTAEEFEDKFPEFESKFHIVLCSIVLCVIEPDDIFRGVLKNIHHLLASEGRGIIAVCNPLTVHVKETSMQTRHVPEDSCYDMKFTYLKTIKSTGRKRTEVHRPISFYENEMNNAGFGIISIEQIIEPGEGISDFLVFTVKKVTQDD